MDLQHLTEASDNNSKDDITDMYKIVTLSDQCLISYHMMYHIFNALMH